MSRYKAYPVYKSSGVDNLGEIPCVWEVMQLKRSVLDCVNGIWGSEPENDGNDTIVIRVADFDRPRLSIVDDGFTYRKIDSKEKRSRLLNRGDLLLEKSGGGEKTLVGQVVLFDKDFAAVTSNFVAKMTPHPSFSGSYLNYVFSRFYSGNINYCSIKQNTGIQNLDSASYLSEKFGFPPLPEQEKIASFLDHETAKIDALIEKQQRLIELLKEKRQAVISHAVTKGLNPNAPMKDSGVEWLGEVPAHWVVKKFSHCTIIKSGQVDPSKLPYSGFTLIAPNHIESGTGKIIGLETAEAQGADSGKYLCSEGEVIYSKIRPNLAKVCLSPSGETICSADMYPISGINGLSNKFLYWSLLSNWFTSFVTLESDRVAMPKINREKLAEIFLPIPPENEQAELVVWLKNKTDIVDALLEKAKLGIEFLQERRTALISAAVTGKIDVRDWQAPA